MSCPQVITDRITKLKYSNQSERTAGQTVSLNAKTYMQAC